MTLQIILKTKFQEIATCSMLQVPKKVCLSNLKKKFNFKN